MKKPSAKEIIKKEYQKKYSTQRYEDSNLYHNCNDIVINAMEEYASEQPAIKDKQLAELEEKILNIENDLHWAEAKLAKHKELIETQKEVIIMIDKEFTKNNIIPEKINTSLSKKFIELRKRISELEKEIQ